MGVRPELEHPGEGPIEMPGVVLVDVLGRKKGIEPECVTEKEGEVYEMVADGRDEVVVVSAEEEGIVDIKVMIGAEKLDSIVMITAVIISIEGGEKEGMERRGGELGLIV